MRRSVSWFMPMGDHRQRRERLPIRRAARAEHGRCVRAMSLVFNRQRTAPQSTGFSGAQRASTFLNAVGLLGRFRGSLRMRLTRPVLRR